MIKVFCDKCGKEILLNTNIIQNSAYANINTMSQNFNANYFRTYDSASGQWLDLCMNCKISSGIYNLNSNKAITQ